MLIASLIRCDWTGHVHVSVAYQHGVHQLTISVSPQAAKLLAGLVGGAPMLLVSAKRDVLLDVVAGKLEATRAVITGRVQVSDLGKLLVFKSAFLIAC
jgi:putative sterol carrier protein